MENDTTSVRFCPVCEQYLPATRQYFKPGKRYTNGLRPRCRVCMGGRYLIDEPPLPEGFKRCCQCKQVKAKSEFHRWKKATDGLRPNCKTCLADDYQLDIENQRLMRRTYYKENRLKILERAKARYKRYASVIRVKNMVKSRTPDYRETKRRWREKNKSRFVSYRHKRDARKLNLPATLTEIEWQACLSYWGHRCCICGRKPDMWTVLSKDHWIPVSKGGGFTADNILPTCFARKGAPVGAPTCNSSRRDRDAADWLVERFGEKKARRIIKSIQNYFDSR